MHGCRPLMKLQCLLLHCTLKQLCLEGLILFVISTWYCYVERLSLGWFVIALHINYACAACAEQHSTKTKCLLCHQGRYHVLVTCSSGSCLLQLTASSVQYSAIQINKFCAPAQACTSTGMHSSQQASIAHCCSAALRAVVGWEQAIWAFA